MPADVRFFFEQNKGFAWADWLKHRAAEGDVRALDALRRRGKDAGYKGNRFVGKESDGFAGIKVDTVTKKGTVIYAEDGMTIRDTGSVLKLAAIPDDKGGIKGVGNRNRAIRKSPDYRRNAAFSG